MSNEIKAALHVAMEAIDAKLRHTGLKPGHENDLRAAKGVLRSMISNLPAASGQQEAVQALREICEKGAAPHDMEDALERLEADGVEVGVPAALLLNLFAAHPAPAQQESGPKPFAYFVQPSGFGPFIECDASQVGAFAAYRCAPVQAALTDGLKQQWRDAYALFKAAFDTPIARRKIEGNPEYLEAARNALRNFNDALATASAAPADQARDARYQEGWEDGMADATKAIADDDSANVLVQLESDLAAILPGTLYMDPPDGGDVSLVEQFRRMGRDAARYRWLRDKMIFSTDKDSYPEMSLSKWIPAPEHNPHQDWVADRFDASVDRTIDAAIASQQKGGAL